MLKRLACLAFVLVGLPVLAATTPTKNRFTPDVQITNNSMFYWCTDNTVSSPAGKSASIGWFTSPTPDEFEFDTDGTTRLYVRQFISGTDVAFTESPFKFVFADGVIYSANPSTTVWRGVTLAGTATTAAIQAGGGGGITGLLNGSLENWSGGTGCDSPYPQNWFTQSSVCLSSSRFHDGSASAQFYAVGAISSNDILASRTGGSGHGANFTGSSAYLDVNSSTSYPLTFWYKFESDGTLFTQKLGVQISCYTNATYFDNPNVSCYMVGVDTTNPANMTAKMQGSGGGHCPTNCVSIDSPRDTNWHQASATLNTGTLCAGLDSMVCDLRFSASSGEPGKNNSVFVDQVVFGGTATSITAPLSMWALAEDEAHLKVQTSGSSDTLAIPNAGGILATPDITSVAAGANTITNAYGVKSGLTLTSSGAGTTTVTNAYGLYSSQPSFGTNSYAGAFAGDVLIDNDLNATAGQVIFKEPSNGGDTVSWESPALSASVRYLWPPAPSASSQYMTCTNASPSVCTWGIPTGTGPTVGFINFTGNSGTATAETTTDTLTLTGAGITNVVCSDVTDTCTFTSTEVDGDPANELQNLFDKIVVSGQSDVDADSTHDTLTLVGAGTVTLTTNTSTDTVTITGAAGVANHNLLDGSVHPDTAAGTVARGDLVIGQAATPKWTRLALGTTGKILRSDGTDASWSTTTWPNTAATGDLLYASGTSAYANLADVAVGSYLRSGGVTTAPLWSTLLLPNAATDGDLFYSNAANTMVALAKNTTATRYLSNTGTSNRPAWAQVALGTGVSGTLPVANGGTNLTASADDNVMVGNGTTWETKALTTCTGTNKAVTYDASTNTWGCNTVTGSGGTVTGTGTANTMTKWTGTSAIGNATPTDDGTTVAFAYGKKLAFKDNAGTPKSISFTAATPFAENMDLKWGMTKLPGSGAATPSEHTGWWYTDYLGNVKWADLQIDATARRIVTIAPLTGEPELGDVYVSNDGTNDGVTASYLTLADPLSTPYTFKQYPPTTHSYSWTWPEDPVPNNYTLHVPMGFYNITAESYFGFWLDLPTAAAQGDLWYVSADAILGADNIALGRLAKSTSATRYLSNTGTSNNPAWAQVDLSNGVTGTLPIANGGTNLTAASDDNVMVGNATTWESKALPDSDTGGKFLRYDTSGNAFSTGNLVKTTRDAKNVDALALTGMAERPLAVVGTTAVTASKAWITPISAITANDTNYATITVYKRDTNGGTQTQVFQITTKTSGSGGTGDWVGYKAIDMGSASNATTTAGWIYTWEVTKSGTGVQLPFTVLTLEWTVD